MPGRDDRSVVLILVRRAAEIDELDVGVGEEFPVRISLSRAMRSASRGRTEEKGRERTRPGTTFHELLCSRMFSGFRSVWTSLRRWTSAMRGHRKPVRTRIEQPAARDGNRGLTADRVEELPRKALHVTERKRLVLILLEKVEDGDAQ